MNPEERAPNDAMNPQYLDTYLADYVTHPSSDDESSPVNGTTTISAATYADGAMSGRERARRRWITVEVIVVFVTGAFGIMSTLKGQYIRQRIADDLFENHTLSNESMCDMGNATADVENHIQAITSKWLLYLSIASNLPSIFSILFLGMLSERYGRRLMILVPCVGFFIQSIDYLIVVYLDLPLEFFLIGDITLGVTGGLNLFMAGCYAYVTDITTEKKRMVRIVITEMLSFGGIAIVQIALGYLIRDIGYARTLWIPFALMLVSCVNAGTPYLLIETVSSKSDAEQQNLNDVFAKMIHLFSIKRGNRQFLLVTYMLIYTLLGIVTEGSMQIPSLYGMGQPFCWKSVTIGFYGTLALLIPLTGTVVGAAVFDRCKLAYLWIVQISSASGLLNVLALAMTFVVQTTTLIFASTFLGLLKLLGVPVVRTSLTTIVDKHEHGALFAALGVLDGIETLLAPLVFNGIYSATVEIFPTTVFFVMAATQIIPIVLTGVLQCKGLGQKREDRHLLVANGESEDEQGQEPLLPD